MEAKNMTKTKADPYKEYQERMDRERIYFHLPTRPYGIVDAHNRAAAAKGSLSYADATHGADYNGHHVGVDFNTYRGYWVTEYTWNGRNVLARGSFADAINAAKAEHERGALGSSAHLTIQKDHPEAASLAALAEATGWTRGSSEDRTWHTWRHKVAAESARDYAHPGAMVLIFDLALLEAAEDRNGYMDALNDKYGRIWQ
jgi:hypothetical protein